MAQSKSQDFSGVKSFHSNISTRAKLGELGMCSNRGLTDLINILGSNSRKGVADHGQLCTLLCAMIQRRQPA